MNRFFTFLLCVTLIASCAEFDNSSSRGSIAGSVIDKSTGETIPTVNVELTPTGAKKVTGMNGTFEFNNVKTGEYIITTNKEGYESGSTTITVSSGEVAECYILMERIPAVITPSKEELDFGSNYSTNTQSFNIVNPHYETLHWEIINNCGWITSVSPMQGSLDYSKTATIVVKIDRELLSEGENVAILVLSTEGGGSVDIVVKAMRKTPKEPSLNVLEVTNISASKATFNGQIVDPGYPEYIERGFVYSETTMPTIETTIHLLSVPITSDTNYSYDVMGLTEGKTYYVRAYAKNQVGVAYSFNQMTFIAAEIDDSNFINLPAAGIAVQKNDVVSFTMRWDEANRLCNDSKVSGLTDWRLPTIEELSIMYANKDYIGGFVTYGQAYWSSYEGNANGTLYHLTKHFGSGDEGRASSQYAGYARCVRTLTK